MVRVEKETMPLFTYGCGSVLRLALLKQYHIQLS